MLFRVQLFTFGYCQILQVANREPVPCYHGAYSVGTLGGHVGRKAGNAL